MTALTLPCDCPLWVAAIRANLPEGGLVLGQLASLQTYPHLHLVAAHVPGKNERL